jgi:membrane fusion protein (multidrug efflux system)
MLRRTRTQELAGRLAAGLLAGLLLAAASAVPVAAQDGGRPAVPVEAASVESGPLAAKVAAVGTLLSNESVVIRPEIAGRITAIHFEEGVPVEDGAPLFSLDDTIYQAELAEIQARMKLAESNYERIRELYKKSAATGRQRDEAVSELAVSKASIQLARARLAKTRITAPFAGIVGLRTVSVGDYVNPGQDLVKLEAIQPIKVDFRVAERFLPALRTGQTIEITVDAFSGRSFVGEVYAIDPQIDPEGRSVILRARIPNTDRLLRPGLFARVSLIIEDKPQALTIPEQAIVPRGEEQFVFVVKDDKAHLTKVVTGIRREGRVEILDGLAAGDTVVTAGQLKLRDGAAVSVVAPRQDPAA